MAQPRRSWPKAIAITLAVMVALGGLFAVTIDAKADDAKGAAADLDGLFSLSAVAEMEGALHEEGTLAIPYAIGFIEQDEFDVAVAATDSARVALLEEITYYSDADPLGSALRAIDTSLEGLDDHRAAIERGDVDGSVLEPYRFSIDATTAAMAPIRSRLVVPGMDPVALLAVDEARRASSDAVMAATAAALGQGEADTVQAALDRADAAELAFAEAGSAARVDQLSAAIEADGADRSRSGVVAVAAGDPFDLLAWGDVAADWPLAYADVEIDAVETGLAALEARATGAEADAKTYALFAGITSVLAVLLTLVVARRFMVGPRPDRSDASMPSADGTLPV